MKTGLILLIIIGCFEIIIGALYLLFGVYINFFLIFIGIFVIMFAIFNYKGYKKKSYIANFSLFALWGLILIYILFGTNNYLGDRNLFYFQTIILICFIILSGRAYINKRKKGAL